MKFMIYFSYWPIIPMEINLATGLCLSDLIDLSMLIKIILCRMNLIQDRRVVSYVFFVIELGLIFLLLSVNCLSVDYFCLLLTGYSDHVHYLVLMFPYLSKHTDLMFHVLPSFEFLKPSKCLLIPGFLSRIMPKWLHQMVEQIFNHYKFFFFICLQV
jgi:hypothetical protein